MPDNKEMISPQTWDSEMWKVYVLVISKENQRSAHREQRLRNQADLGLNSGCVTTVKILISPRLSLVIYKTGESYPPHRSVLGLNEIKYMKSLS